MNSTNFSELYYRIPEWSADDEDIVIKYLKSILTIIILLNLLNILPVYK